ncbi:MAG: DegT/DnrJ/EryC1/StrS family aminotransferase [Candidatus Omnitrophica bacterium]|nr:DegT/DnrJ/EryC1/StrS family aminotransferase [Candidatus Omnitrophota bacterium]
MSEIRYESILVEKALAREYASLMEKTLKKVGGLNDIKPLTYEFERSFARYIGVKEAVSVNSGSDALKIALLLAGVKKGDEVIVPDLTYQAVALAVFYCGAKPVPVDARADDLQIDPQLLRLAITKKTKAVIGAHMFGRPCDVEAIKKICKGKGIVFIEDVCQAESSRYKGCMLGSFGDMSVFSFSYYKPLSSCAGGGGMVVCDKQQGTQIRRWQEDWRDDEDLLSLGQRFAPLSFMDLMALEVKWKHLPEIIQSRHQIKALYEQGLEGIKGLTFFKDKPLTESVAQNFVVFCSQRDKLSWFLKEKGITVQKPYVPLHQMSAFKRLNKKQFKVSDKYFTQALHLPLPSFMSVEKAGFVIDACRAFFRNHH